MPEPAPTIRAVLVIGILVGCELRKASGSHIRKRVVRLQSPQVPASTRGRACALGNRSACAASRYCDDVRETLTLDSPAASSALATLIALLESGAADELVPRLVSEEEIRTPEHVAVNGDGEVAVLVTES